MTRNRWLIASVFLLTVTACDNPDRLARLEKQNQELHEKVTKSRIGEEYDLQAKCSKDAKKWFEEHWSRDKDTILLDFTNHHNKTMNKCFIVTEYHYNPTFLENGSWMNDMELTDVYENVSTDTLVKNTK